MVDIDRRLEVMVGFAVLFLLLGNRAKTPPGIVMRRVNCQRSFVASFCVLVVFISYVFMSAKSVRVGEVLVELDGSVEELKRSLVLFLQAVAVADYAPGLGRKQGLFKCKVAQVS